MFRKPTFLILLALFVLAVPAVHALCPGGQFYLDLKSCATATLAGVSFMSGGACANAVATTACPAAAGWKQAALKIVVPAGCTQANVVVEYEGLPCGWTVDLGDSPTDNGFGGDSGSTPHNAELQIVDENLSLIDGSGNAALIDNPLAVAHLALTDSAMKFVVKDQFVSWGNPYTYVQAPASKNLFSFTDPVDPRTVYLGLNRVVLATGGRTGYGARRVLVTFK
ncbi:MAG TPA: hypothetical protein VH988_21755 [Thermoanaerobaculia bacterium]|jgi:hypothetical protein|nr:hypothetical protein [Thermoanaerobaculia bacterium]